MATRHALIVGVDKYINLDKKYELEGCVNDAQLIESILIDRFGFESQNMQALHNEDATRVAILKQMRALAERIERDDIVVFHFSGHGSRRRSTDPEEASGKDSTIMPYDSGRHPKPNLDISDKEINAWLHTLAQKTRNITLTFDCCHSGTITRDAFGAKVRAIADDDRTLEEMGLTPETPVVATRGERGKGGWLAISTSYVVLSGCRDDEYSHEYSYETSNGTARNGALTHFLTGALMAATPGTTYRDVFEIARQQVHSRFPSQHPQIEGTQDRELFGIRDIEPIRFVPVQAIAGSSVTLAGGGAHGVHEDSVWAVYPPATKSTEGLEPLAMLDVRSVHALHSEATLRDLQGDVVIGARCIEHTPSVAQYRLSVNLTSVGGAVGHALTDAVAKSPLLRVSSGETADVCAYTLASRTHAAAGEPLPQIGAIETPSIALVNAEGALAMPLRPQDAAGSVPAIVQNLERMSRYRNALALDNPDSKLDVDFNIYREDANGEWVLANGGEAVLTAGDALCFEIVNRESVPVFFSVLDFGLTGRIKLLFPSNKTSEMLAADRTVRLGGGTKRLRLSVPDDFVADRGTETLKAFITREEADFSWLQQEGVRSAGARSALRTLFEAAYNGPATRDLSFDDDDEPNADEQDWKAVSRSFDLQRK
ncbi:MAG: caspase domain-containing protein [Gammaproteobacteria bacterium]